MEHPLCEKCGIRFSVDVHHIKPLKEYPELALDPDNLEALCKRCHAKETRQENTETL